MFMYRKIRYFTEKEAQDFADRRNNENRRANMVASVYHEAEEKPGCFRVDHYVAGSVSMSFVKSGVLPYDYDEGYREGFHQTRIR